MKDLLCCYVIYIACVISCMPAVAEPSCVRPDAKNYVVATTPSVLADGWEAAWLLQNVETSDRIFLRRCSIEKPNCYYAVDVVPGKYFFERAEPSGLNNLEYPISRSGLWFQITGQGVDYIGDWKITRNSQRVIKSLQITYSLKSVDEIVRHCKLKGKKLYLDRTKTLGSQVVD